MKNHASTSLGVGRRNWAVGSQWERTDMGVLCVCLSRSLPARDPEQKLRTAQIPLGLQVGCVSPFPSAVVLQSGNLRACLLFDLLLLARACSWAAPASRCCRRWRLVHAGSGRGALRLCRQRAGLPRSLGCLVSRQYMCPIACPLSHRCACLLMCPCLGPSRALYPVRMPRVSCLIASPDLAPCRVPASRASARAMSRGISRASAHALSRGRILRRVAWPGLVASLVHCRAQVRVPCRAPGLVPMLVPCRAPGLAGGRVPFRAAGLARGPAGAGGGRQGARSSCCPARAAPRAAGPGSEGT